MEVSREHFVVSKSANFLESHGGWQVILDDKGLVLYVLACVGSLVLCVFACVSSLDLLVLASDSCLLCFLETYVIGNCSRSKLVCTSRREKKTEKQLQPQ